MHKIRTYLKKFWLIITFPLRFWWRLGKKRWLFIPLLIGLLIAYSSITAKANVGKPDFKKYDLYSVSGTTIKKKINREGKLFQQGVVPIVQPATGLVKKINFPNGSVVKKGQVIALVESTASPQQKSVAYQKYLVAKNAVSEAEVGKLTSQKSLEEARKLVLDASQTSKDMQARFDVGDKNNSDADRPNKQYTVEEKESVLSAEKTARKSFEIAESNYLTIDNSIAAAKAGLSAAWWDYQSLSSASIISPVDGIVANMVAGEGEYVSLKENEAFAQIVNQAGWVARLSLYEKEAQLVQPGDTATVQMLLNPDQVYQGVVDRVDSQGTLQEDGKETTYNMVVKLNDVQVQAVSGSRVTVDVLFPEKTVSLAVPNAAIRYRDGKRYVQKVISGKVQEQEIEVGFSDASNSEVTSGLANGDQILTFKSK